MSLVVIGLSHRTAPIEVLEAVSIGRDRLAEMARDALTGQNVSEAVVLSTCNRLEVYAEALTFHGAVAEVGESIANATGISMDRLRENLFVLYDDRAVAHLFQVAAGLDSMAVGEAQVLGQLRDALGSAQQHHTIGPVLNALLQQALRVGKRAHAETGIDAVSRSLVRAAIARATGVLGPMSDLSVVVVGAGSMSALAVSTLARERPRSLVVANRTLASAQRLAAAYDAEARPIHHLAQALDGADLVFSCTGAIGQVIRGDDLPPVRPGRRLVYVDLAVPRDVDPLVGERDDVQLVALHELAADLEEQEGEEIQAVGELVVGEVASYLAHRRVDAIGPTVTALRTAAQGVVSQELDRLDKRLPDLDPRTRDEVTRTVHRIVEKLLHRPTARVKELTASGDPADYAAALRQLFDLDAHDLAAMSVPPQRGMP